MYESQTYENIIQRMLSSLDDTIDKREGSVAFDMLAPKAIELAMAYHELDNVINFGFADTTYGSFLDMKADEIGLTRKVAIPATGTVKFTVTTDMIIPQGTIVYTDSGVQFTTDSDVTTVNGSGSVNITAVLGGNQGNIPSQLIINSSISGVACSNPTPTSGGADEESDADLLTRYYTKLQEPVISGNANNYIQWATSITGVGAARVVPLWNGPGTVQVLLIGTDKRAVSAAVVQQVDTYIEQNRPIGATVTVQSAVELPINISAQLTLSQGYTDSSVQQAIQDGISAYLQSAAFVDIDVKYSKIGTTILGVQGVLDYQNLQINGGTSNISLANNQTPVLGTVTLS